MDKNSKIIIDVVERMSVTPLEIEKHCNKIHQQIAEKQFQYLNARDTKMHKKNKNLLNVLASMNAAMCNAFLQNKAKMPPHV